MLNEKTITGLLSAFFVILTLGFLFHQSPTFAGSFPGHLTGIVGGVIMTLTLVYPFRKRVQKKRGKKNPLNRHIYYGLIGPSLLVIHSSHKFSSLIGVVCFLSMFIVVFSGIIGRFLLRRVSRTLKQQEADLSLLSERFEALRKETGVLQACLEKMDPRRSEEEKLPDDEQVEWERDGKCQELLDVAHSIAETEYVVRAFSSAKSVFARWIRVHYILALLLFSLMIVHVLASFYYGIRWL